MRLLSKFAVPSFLSDEALRCHDGRLYECASGLPACIPMSGATGDSGKLDDCRVSYVEHGDLRGESSAQDEVARLMSTSFRTPVRITVAGSGIGLRDGSTRGSDPTYGVCRRQVFADRLEAKCYR